MDESITDNFLGTTEAAAFLWPAPALVSLETAGGNGVKMKTLEKSCCFVVPIIAIGSFLWHCHTCGVVCTVLGHLAAATIVGVIVVCACSSRR